MRKEAFNEIISSFLNIGGSDSSSTEGDYGIGKVYATARYWWTLRADLNSTRITNDGVEIDIDIDGEATAKAGIKDKCGNNVAQTGVKLRLSLSDSLIKFRLKFISTFEESKLKAEGIVDPGRFNVLLTGPGLEEPLATVASWFTNFVVNGIIDNMKIRFRTVIGLDIFSQSNEHGPIQFQTPRLDYFADEAIIFTFRALSIPQG